MDLRRTKTLKLFIWHVLCFIWWPAEETSMPGSQSVTEWIFCLVKSCIFHCLCPVLTTLWICYDFVHCGVIFVRCGIIVERCGSFHVLVTTDYSSLIKSKYLSEHDSQINDKNIKHTNSFCDWWFSKQKKRMKKKLTTQFDLNQKPGIYLKNA